MIAKAARLLLVAALFAAAPLLAAGGDPAPTPTPTLSPAEEAVMHYNRGLKLRDKAWELERELSAAEGAQRDKLAKKIEKQYQKAIREFEAATQKNPSLHQAHSSLGYALRRTGAYGEALTAYDRALELAPGYTEAIEYRAEAYLGLDRLEEAKEAYIELFSSDRERADELLTAMRRWVESRRARPGEVPAEQVSAFESWLAEREEIAERTASLTSGRVGAAW